MLRPQQIMNMKPFTLKHDATFTLKQGATFTLKHDHFTLKYGCNMHMHTETNIRVLALALRYCKDVKLRRAATKIQQLWFRLTIFRRIFKRRAAAKVRKK